MSGSLKWFAYTDDHGSDFALYADESNTEAVNAGTQDYVDSISLLNAIPRNVKPRSLRYTSADGTLTRKVVALTPTIFAGALENAPTITVNGVTLYLRSSTGEKRRLPFAADTGLNDGDAT